MTPVFKPEDVERILKLLHDTTDPTQELSIVERRRLLIEGLAALVEADVWIWSSTAANHAIPGDFMTTCVVDGGWKTPEEPARVFEILSSPDCGRKAMGKIYDLIQAGRRSTFIDGELFPEGEEEHFMEMWRGTGFEHFLLTIYPIDRNFSSNLGLHRRIGRPPFTRRDRMIAQAVYGQVEWLHRSALNEAVREAAIALTPRERQTLIYLLAGHSQKSIAERMGISPHTVNDYLKQIHKRFGVTSRAQLQAHFFLGGTTDARLGPLKSPEQPDDNAEQSDS